MNDSYDYLLKLLIIGDTNSNKQMFINKFIGNASVGTGGSTYGLDYRLKDVQRNGRKIKLQLWDTAGQERFRSITSSFYRGSHGGMLVFTLSKQPSFTALKFWLEEIRSNAPNRFVIVLVGTISSHEEREIAKDIVTTFAQEQNILYFECHIDNGKGIDEAFSVLLDKIMEKFHTSSRDLGDSVRVGDMSTSQYSSKRCCS